MYKRQVQIRGHLVRLELDVLVVATANPEDYTNRGRLITPLKDRFGSQIRTHYPYEITTEIAIIHQEAKLPTSSKPINCLLYTSRPAASASRSNWTPRASITARS